jgi:hypothetical protein
MCTPAPCAVSRLNAAAQHQPPTTAVIRVEGAGVHPRVSCSMSWAVTTDPACAQYSSAAWYRRVGRGDGTVVICCHGRAAATTATLHVVAARRRAAGARAARRAAAAGGGRRHAASHRISAAAALAAATRAAATATTGKRIHGWLRIACSMRHAACLLVGQEGSEASVISPMYTGDRAERLSISSIYGLYTGNRAEKSEREWLSTLSQTEFLCMRNHGRNSS